MPARTGQTNDLFRAAAAKDPSLVPLPERMRPRSVDEIVGQQHILGPNTLLREAIETETVKAISGKLDRYFRGDLTALDDIAVAADGSDFQRQVWTALRKIAAGKTTTYGELARSLGHTDPRVAKDIGAAIGANPIAVVVPCHRVVGKDGKLKGYAWGLQRKHRLLIHEKAEVPHGGTAALFSL